MTLLKTEPKNVDKHNKVFQAFSKNASFLLMLVFLFPNSSCRIYFANYSSDKNRVK